MDVMTLPFVKRKKKGEEEIVSFTHCLRGWHQETTTVRERKRERNKGLSIFYGPFFFPLTKGEGSFLPFLIIQRGEEQSQRHKHRHLRVFCWATFNYVFKTSLKDKRFLFFYDHLIRSTHTLTISIIRRREETRIAVRIRANNKGKTATRSTPLFSFSLWLPPPTWPA